MCAILWQKICICQEGFNLHIFGLLLFANIWLNIITLSYFLAFIEMPCVLVIVASSYIIWLHIPSQLLTKIVKVKHPEPIVHVLPLMLMDSFLSGRDPLVLFAFAIGREACCVLAVYVLRLSFFPFRTILPSHYENLCLLPSVNTNRGWWYTNSTIPFVS